MYFYKYVLYLEHSGNGHTILLTYRESVSSTETTADVDGVLSSKMDNLDLAKHREEPRVSLEQVQVVS